MRTHRNRSSLSISCGASRPTARLGSGAALGLLLGVALLPAAAFGQATDGKVKYLYKPVPCSPCPCECPDTRDKGPVPRAFTSPEPTQRSDSDSEGREVREVVREVRPAPSPRPSSGGGGSGGGSGGGGSEPPAPSGSQVRGNLGGVVTLRDRGGKDKADRSGVVVYIEQLPNKKFAALKKVRQMAQRDKSFVPGVVAITRGSTVDFPNEDKFFHNVFSLSDGNTFDLGLYRAGESKSVTFEKTGVVDVYCNIHPNMWAQILVLDNPFFTTAAKDGSFEIAKLPPGTYSVAAWVSGGEPVRQQVKIEPNKRVDVALAVREGVNSKPHLNKFNQPYERYK